MFIRRQTTQTSFYVYIMSLANHKKLFSGANVQERFYETKKKRIHYHYSNEHVFQLHIILYSTIQMN